MSALSTLQRHVTELMQLIKRCEADSNYDPASLERLRDRLAEAENALEVERRA